MSTLSAVLIYLVAAMTTFSAGYCLAMNNYFREWNRGFQKGCELGRQWLDEERQDHIRQREFDKAIGRYQVANKQAPNAAEFERQIQELMKKPLS